MTLCPVAGWTRIRYSHSGPYHHVVDLLLLLLLTTL
jgi:hypothetical protein